jgi:hypothetical protein
MKDWIEEKLENSRRLVIDHSHIIISQFNEENERRREYNGRQLLEMLQNAEDQIVDDGLVIIKLYEDRLVIANKGNPFSKKGVESLMTSNLSSKQQDDTKIGAKGLGFRSLLNWSESIEIISNDLSIEFSKVAASQFLQEIFDENPGLKEDFRERSEEPFPIPILMAPKWKDVQLEKFKDFGAVITVRFKKSSKIYDDIKIQLGLIDEGAQIFLRKLTKIQIFIYENDEAVVIREVIKTSNLNSEENKVRIVIRENGVETLNKTWSILSRTGVIPKEIQEQGFHNFEIKVAVSDQSEDKVNRLFTFFKTDVYFGFSGLVHGTFQLTGSRNHLVKGAINTFLFKELCHLLIDVATLVSAKGVNWLPLKLLSFDLKTEEELKDFNFYKQLVIQITEAKLFPTVHDTYISYSEKPVFYKENFADVVPFKKHAILPNLLKHSDEENLIRLLNQFGPNGQKGMFEYKQSFLKSTLDSISENLSIEERTSLILFVAKREIFNSSFIPQLLLSESSKLISNSFDIFIRSEDSSFVVPPEIEICFLNGDLIQKIKDGANLKTNHEVTVHLARFNIHDYSLLAVLKKAVAREKKKREAGTELSLLVKLIGSLFEYWKTTTSRPSISEIDFELPSRKMTMASARSLHFGSNIKSSRNSEMNEKILLSDNDLFVCDMKVLQLPDSKEVVDFLQWIGVKDQIEPKKVSVSVVPKSYLSEVIDHLGYPFTTAVNGKKIASSSDFFGRASNFSLETQTITGIENAIKSVKPEILICWLACHKEILKILEGQNNQKLRFKLDNLYSWETIDDPNLLPVYIGHLLSDTAWLPTLGELERPEKCVLTEFELLGSIVPSPSIKEDDEIFIRHNITSEQIHNVLHLIGVKKDFSHLTQTSLYDLVFRLPETDTLGKNARVLYRAIFQLLCNRDFNEMDSGYKRFIESGRVLVKSAGQLLYVPIKDAYYLEDHHSLSGAIIRQINVFEIETGLASKQVKDIFGVRPISDICYKISHDHKQLHPFNDQFKEDLNSFKIAFYSDLMKTDFTGSNLTILKNLNVNIYSSFKAEFTIKDQSWQPLDISNLEYVNIDHHGCIETYVYVQSQEYESFDSLKEKIKFTESIVSVVCNSLDIINDSKYNYLYSRSENGRKELTSTSNGGDTTFYDRSEAALLSVEKKDDSMEEFWKSVLEVAGRTNGNQLTKDDLIGVFCDKISKEDLIEIIDGITYIPINSQKNLGLIRRLFSKLGIDLLSYNKKATQRLNFQSALQEEINSEHYKLGEKFSFWLYDDLSSKSAEQKKMYFDNLHLFNRQPEIEFSFESLDHIFFYDKWLKSNWGLSHKGLSSNERTLNINEIIAKNTEQLKEQSEPNLLTRLSPDDYTHKSLLLFGEIEALKAILKASINTTLDGLDSVSIAIEYFAKLEAKNNANNSHTEEKNWNQSNKKGSAPHFGGGRSPYSSTKVINESKAKTGLKGERLVYSRLSQKPNIKNLQWLSENAKEAGFSVIGDDSLGYDMRYIDETGNLVYLEVKSSIHADLEFTMSITEFEFALENMNNYAIVIVNEIESENPKFNFIRLSDVPDGLKSGKDFLLQTESYRIRVLANSLIRPL